MRKPPALVQDAGGIFMQFIGTAFLVKKQSRKRPQSFPEHAFTRKAVSKNDVFKNCCIVRFRPTREIENRINLRNKTTL